MTPAARNCEVEVAKVNTGIDDSDHYAVTGLRDNSLSRAVVDPNGLPSAIIDWITICRSEDFTNVRERCKIRKPIDVRLQGSNITDSRLDRKAGFLQLNIGFVC